MQPTYYGYEEKCIKQMITLPPQHQPWHPGLEWMMEPRPIYDDAAYIGSNKLQGKVAIITGGDSGIGRAVSIAFAKEGADVVIVYLYEDRDAMETKQVVEQYGVRCLLIRGDLRESSFSKEIVKKTLAKFGSINILVNNAAVQYPKPSILEISDEQLENTFRTNIFSYFYLTKAVLPHLTCHDTIINTASITAYNGFKNLIDYSSTKGAIVSFTRSLSLSLIDQKIRVNAVAPGPIWTPLIPSSFSAEEVKTFGADTNMKRPGQPFELAPAYVYLASNDSSYVSGQVIHVNGGEMVSS
ncbi:SDR family oxidoreductase [Haloplasma contractile]|uniref:1-deoxy-D-xylulose-5-phosphate reductoisomerase protein n=1 Tax=Haloplasma contractile SSD-17B TaxID=1033810 RepID=U2FSG4_9MOLU|nr:SDR family oxidoreductase [Haloplasma contractile]ERJ13874.1 1-deoxy-D-xylulose-5-phosphate reductoisomerase protein [Haloplasma contractile SSD-17B]